MQSLLQQSKSKKDIEIMATLAKMIGLKARHLSDEEMEETGLAMAMKNGRTGEFVDTVTYLKETQKEKVYAYEC